MKKMNVKAVSSILIIAMLICSLFAMPANAVIKTREFTSNPNLISIHVASPDSGVQYFAEELADGSIYIHEVSTDKVGNLNNAGFSTNAIAGTSFSLEGPLAIGEMRSTSTAFNLVLGVSTLEYTISWTPANQAEVRLGVFPKGGGTFTGIYPVNGSSKKTTKFAVPNGEYQVAILNMSSVNVTYCIADLAWIS